jgi:hypothetical protein
MKYEKKYRWCFFTSSGVLNGDDFEKGSATTPGMRAKSILETRDNVLPQTNRCDVKQSTSALGLA